MTRNKILLFLFMLALVSPLMAETISVGDLVYWRGGIGQGGPFTLSFEKNGAPVSSSFCLELDEELDNPMYVYGIGDIAFGGGKNTNSGDPLSLATKVLVYNYVNNTLPSTLIANGLSIWDFNVNNTTSDIQSAIWHLEGESGYWANAWETWAQTQSYDTKYDSVKVLNLAYTKKSHDSYVPDLNRNGSYKLAQDLTYVIPPSQVPEPGSLFLLGTGILGIAAIARRKK